MDCGNGRPIKSLQNKGAVGRLIRHPPLYQFIYQAAIFLGTGVWPEAMIIAFF